MAAACRLIVKQTSRALGPSMLRAGGPMAQWRQVRHLALVTKRRAATQLEQSQSKKSGTKGNNRKQQQKWSDGRHPSNSRGRSIGGGKGGGGSGHNQAASVALFVDGDWLGWHVLAVERPARFGIDGKYAGMEHSVDVTPILDAASSGRSGRKLAVASMQAYTTLPSSLASDLVEGMASAGIEVLTWPSTDDAGSGSLAADSEHQASPTRAHRTTSDGPGFAAAPSAAALAVDAALAGMGFPATDGRRNSGHGHGSNPARVVIAGASPAYSRVVVRLAQLGRSSSVICTPAEWSVFSASLPEFAQRRVAHIPATDAMWEALLPLTGDSTEEEGDDYDEEDSAATDTEDHEGDAADEEHDDLDDVSSVVGDVEVEASGSEGAAGTERLARDMARALSDFIRTRRPLGTSVNRGTYASIDEVSAALMQSGGVLGTLRRGDMTAVKLATEHPTILRVLSDDERKAASSHMMSLKPGARGQLSAGSQIVLEVMPKKVWGRPEAFAELLGPAQDEPAHDRVANEDPEVVADTVTDHEDEDEPEADDDEEEEEEEPEADDDEEEEEPEADDDEEEEEPEADDDEEEDDNEPESQDEDDEDVEGTSEEDTLVVYVDDEGNEVQYESGDEWEYVATEQLSASDEPVEAEEDADSRTAVRRCADVVVAAVDTEASVSALNAAFKDLVASSFEAGLLASTDYKPTKLAMGEILQAMGEAPPKKSETKTVLACRVARLLAAAAHE